MSAHANFVSVHVPQPSSLQCREGTGDPPQDTSPQNFIWELAGKPTTSLLCTARGLLKKMKQKVFVGDIVTVSNIDWITAQGELCHLYFNASLFLTSDFQALTGDMDGMLLEKLWYSALQACPALQSSADLGLQPYRDEKC